jgi:hypothetical protein
MATRKHRFSIELMLAIFVLLHALFALELYLDLHHNGTFWEALRGSAAMARTSATTVSRAYNVLVSLVLTSIAIAVPLTANMYTPKLTDLFVRDKVNLTVMIFFVCSSANAIWAAHATWDQGALRDQGGLYPRTAVWVALETMTLGWSVLIPWFFYVFRFLDPANIIQRLAAQVEGRIDRIAKAADVAAAQADFDQQILHTGNVILRALDRADRDVTLDAIRALRHIVRRYQTEKSRLPEAWLDAPAHLFTGLSEEAVDLIRRDRIWVEHKCLHQLSLAYNASLAKMQDAISAISDVNRDLVVHAESVGDEGTLRLGIRYFNTFIREAIKRKDAHAIFDVFYQYRELARSLVGKHAGLTLEIGHHLKYYAEFARLSGLPFIHELASYDLESMVESAYSGGASAGRPLLVLLCEFEATPPSLRLTKSKLIAAGYFQQRGLGAEVALVQAALRKLPREMVEDAAADLLHTTDPVFWEVTDRCVNIDYVDDARKQAIGELVSKSAALPASG